MLAITGSQGSGVDFSVPVIVLMVVLSALSTDYLGMLRRPPC